jgi:hypothetical protein
MTNILLILALLLFFTGSITIVVLGIIGTYLIIAGKFMHFSPPVPSSGKVKKKMLAHAAKYLEKKQNLTITDLGSGWGTLLLPLAKNFPSHRFIGYELAKLPYYTSKFRALKLQNIQIKRQDFFNADFSDIDVILCFLLPSAMQQCHDKILPNLKKGTIIYANRFPLPTIEPIETVSLGSDYETFYVYKI